MINQKNPHDHEGSFEIKTKNILQLKIEPVKLQEKNESRKEKFLN